MAKDKLPMSGKDLVTLAKYMARAGNPNKKKIDRALDRYQGPDARLHKSKGKDFISRHSRPGVKIVRGGAPGLGKKS